MATVEEYMKQLKRTIDWDWVVATARQNVQVVDDTPLGFCLLGTVFSLTPSGKYYMPWCTNFTEKEARADERWYTALDKVAEENNGWIEGGEGDPCDIFFVTDSV